MNILKKITLLLFILNPEIIFGATQNEIYNACLKDPLIKAEENHDMALLKKLAQSQGTSYREDPLCPFSALQAVVRSPDEINDLDSVRILVENGADVNEAPDRIDYFTGERFEPILTIAIKHQGQYSREVIELLLNYGANVNRKSNQGILPLDEAYAMGNNEIADLLIQHGAKTNGNEINGPSHESVVEEFTVELSIVDKIIYFISWLWDSMSWWMIVGLIAAWYYKDFLIKEPKRFLNAKRDKANEEAKVLLKGKIRRINEKLNRIETDYLLDEAKEVAKLRGEVNEVTKILDQKADKYDFSGIKKNLENLEKASQQIVKKVDGLNAEMSKVKEVYDRVKSDYETISMISMRISEEIRSYEGFEGVESFQSRVMEQGDRRSQAKELIEKVKMFEDMKRFAEQDAQYIEVTIRDIKALEGEWENFKAGVKEYQSLMSQAKKTGEKASRLRAECSSVGGDEAAIALERTFAGIVDDLQMMAQDMRSTSTRKEALYYADRIRLLDQKLNETETEFNEKFKAVIEFKRLPNDMAKKEWILKNGYISWFFDDPKIAEKFREFDSMEEKFKYLIKASKKLRFLDIEQREEKTTWPVFMQRIHSDMSYAEMKSFMDEWQTDPKFPKIVEQWFKKLTEQDAEQKQEIMVTQKFIGLKF